MRALRRVEEVGVKVIFQHWIKHHGKLCAEEG
jgi:hypothetical protein